MRAFLVFLVLALIAMAAAFPQGVNVVDNNNPGQGYYGVNRPTPVHFVNNRPGNGNFGGNRPNRPVHIVNNNRPGSVHFVDNNPYNPNNPGVHFINNNPYDNNNPGQVNFVNNNNPNDPTSVNFVNNNPNDGTSVNFVNNSPSDGTAVHVVDNNPGEGNWNTPSLSNPDPAFGRPTYETPDISPAFVQRPPGKQYDNPYLRGGK